MFNSFHNINNQTAVFQLSGSTCYTAAVCMHLLLSWAKIMENLNIYTKTEFTNDPKWNSSFVLMFMLSGELTIFAGNKERRLHTNDFTFIRPFELHGGSSGQDICEALIIDIGPDLWPTFLPNADSIVFDISILRSNDRGHAYASICKSLAQIVHYNVVSEKSSQARICEALSSIFATLVENYTSGAAVQKTSDQNMQRIQEILQYIVNNYTHRLSLEEISGAIGFHPQYFSAYFKKHFGVSFTDYLNNYRINRSISLLRDTNDSILNIALACGFNSHKTYSNAFEKQYHCSPREYRKTLRSRIQPEISDIDQAKYDYLRSFWSSRSLQVNPLQPGTSKCSIILENTKPLFENTAHNFISIGRAMSILRSDMQDQLINAKRDLNLEFVRIRDVFSDDLFVYYEDRNKTPVFSWRALDEIFDFLISAGLKPFIELGYMPGQLASRKQYAGWQYRPNVSSPKSPKLWEMLVNSFITHLISRYGKSTIEGWLFDFWTSPNLNMEHGYWNESIEKFFQFYRLTYNAVKSINANIRFGSPNFSYPTGFCYYEQFLEFAGNHKLYPDFISSHLYSCGDGENNPAGRFIEYSVFDNNYHIPNIKPERHTIPGAIDELCGIINNSQYAGLPIVIDDWNVTFFPTDFTRDTCFMGPFVVETLFNSCQKIYGMGFASLSDIHEDFFNTDQLFNGGPGLLTYSGIPKSAYYAMSMAYRFSRQILLKGSNYIVGKTDSGYEILVYNMDFYNDDYVGNDPSIISFNTRYNVFEDIPDMECHISLTADIGVYSIVRTLIGRNCGSSYDAWARMGSPSDITPEISRYLRRVSTPDMKFQTINCTGRIILDEVLEPHSVLHIEISRV